jgi:hypothetical protein
MNLITIMIIIIIILSTCKDGPLLWIQLQLYKPSLYYFEYYYNCSPNDLQLCGKHARLKQLFRAFTITKCNAHNMYNEMPPVTKSRPVLVIRLSCSVYTIFFWRRGVFKIQFIIIFAYLNTRSYIIILHYYYYYVPYLMKIILLLNF